MNSSTLRYLWALIEETQTSTLLHLEDTDLVQQLVNQLSHRQILSPEEANIVSSYLFSKTSLIRAIAYSRRCS
ncbi:MAG: hypothetical protein HC772_09825 [Leptolyngbyaceae cyanobacterium CRU_2_3]|nr:hypothetical protein [Leptolyngbyaceae cyanobacterium CRU_2_3]